MAATEAPETQDAGAAEDVEDFTPLAMKGERGKRLGRNLDDMSFVLALLVAPALINLGLIANIITWDDPGGALVGLGLLALVDGFVLLAVAAGIDYDEEPESDRNPGQADAG